MICEKCGKELENDAKFCPACGAAVVQKEIKQDKTNATLRKTKKFAICFGIVFVLLAGVVIFLLYNQKPSVRYKKAESAMNRSEYEVAIELFTELGDYEDAAERLESAIMEKHYKDGKQYVEEGNYDAAISEFLLVEDDETVQELINMCNYKKACDNKNNHSYVDAAELFKESDYYEDADELILEMGKELIENKNYADAFLVLKNSQNSTNSYLQYAVGMENLEKQDYSSAANAFKIAGDIYDAKDRLKEAFYLDAEKKFAKKEYGKAVSLYEKAQDYKDAVQKIDICKLMTAKELYDDGSLNKAKKELEKIPANTTYGDVSAENLLKNINDHSEWLALCGVWTSTSGQMRTREDGSYNYYYWYLDFSEGDHNITVKCKINDDGTVTVITSGSLPVYTNYSSYSQYLTTGTKSLSAEKIMSNPNGKISLNSNLSLSISTSSISADYKYVDNTKDVYFTYTYTTTIKYGKRTQKL